MLSDDTGPEKQDPEEARDGNSDLQETNTSETEVALRSSYILRSSVRKDGDIAMYIKQPPQIYQNYLLYIYWAFIADLWGGGGDQESFLRAWRFLVNFEWKMG